VHQRKRVLRGKVKLYTVFRAERAFALHLEPAFGRSDFVAVPGVTPNREAGREHGDSLESDDATGVPQATAKELFAQFERAFAAQGGDAVRRAALMVAIADAIAAHGRVPGSLVPVVEDVVAAWKTAGHVPDADLLLRANVAVWAALEGKNGDSTTVADIIDRTLRAFLCLTEVVRLDEAMDYAGWAAEMLSTEEWPRPLMYF
jgi:hypothetical protein